MKKLSLPLIILLVIFAVVYFQSSPSEVAAQTKFQDESVQMIVSSNQPTASSMHENSFALTLKDTSGNPIQQADLQATLVMPNMYCGIIPTEIVEDEPGTYQVKGIPVMQGKWEVQITLKTTSKLIHVKHPFIAD